MFEGIDENLRRKILVENICAHLGLDSDADITETPPGPHRAKSSVTGTAG